MCVSCRDWSKVAKLLHATFRYNRKNLQLFVETEPNFQDPQNYNTYPGIRRNISSDFLFVTPVLRGTLKKIVLFTQGSCTFFAAATEVFVMRTECPVLTTGVLFSQQKGSVSTTKKVQEPCDQKSVISTDYYLRKLLFSLSLQVFGDSIQVDFAVGHLLCWVAPLSSLTFKIQVL